MATLLARVEDLVGTYADSGAIDQWLSDGARGVILALPPELLWTVSADLSDAGSGVAVSNSRVLYAHVAGRFARRILASMKATASDAGSLWKATSFAPVYWLEHGKAFVYGDTAGGTVAAVAYPTVTGGLSTITGYPVDADHLPVLYAASMIQRSRAMQTVAPTLPAAITPPSAPTLDTVSYSAPAYGPPDIAILLNIPNDESLILPTPPGLTWSAPTISLPTVPTFSTFTISASAPTPPGAPSISYTDALVSAIGTTSIAALPAPPSFPTVTFGGSISIPSLPTLSFGTKIDGLTSLALPTVPTAPSFSFSDAVLGTWAAAATVGALPAVPAYTAATFGGSLTIPTLPTLAFVNKVDGSTPLVSPSAPSVPAIAYTDATLATWASAATIAALPTIPVLGSATFGGNIADITSGLPNDVDLSTEIDGITALDPPVAPTAPAITGGTIGTATIGALPATPPSFTEVNPTLTFTEWDTYEGYEDPEMMREILNKITLELQEFDAQMRDNQITFQANVEEYRAEVQKVIEQARIELQENSTQLTEDNRVALQNYALKLQQHDQDMKKYAAEIDRQVQEARTNLAIAVEGKAERERLWMQKYQIEVQNEQAEFNGAMQDHMAEVQRLIEQAKYDQEILRVKFETETDLNLKNEAATLQAAIADYDAELKLYAEELQQYQVDVNDIFRKWEADFKKAVEPWVEQQRLYISEYAEDIKQAMAEYRGLMEDHQYEVQRLIAQSQLDQQILSEKFKAETDLNIQNEIQTTQGDLNNYELILKRYLQEVQQYDMDVRHIFEEWQADYKKAVEPWVQEQQMHLQKFQHDIEAASAEWRGLMEDHMAEVQRVIQQAQLDQERLIQTANLTTDLNLKNEAQTMAALIANAEVGARVYESQVAGYRVEVEAEVQDFVIDEIQIKMAKWQEEASQALRKYEADITAETNRMRSASEAFQNESNAIIREYEALTGRALAAYKAESEVLVAGFKADLDASVADFESQIQEARLDIDSVRFANESKTALFQGEVVAYQAQSQENINLLRGDLELFIQSRNGYFADAENLMGLYREGLASFIGRSYDPKATNRDNQGGASR